MSRVFDPGIFDGNVFDEAGSTFVLSLAGALVLHGHPLTAIELLIQWVRANDTGAFDPNAFDAVAFQEAPSLLWKRLFYT